MRTAKTHKDRHSARLQARADDYSKIIDPAVADHAIPCMTRHLAMAKTESQGSHPWWMLKAHIAEISSLSNGQICNMMSHPSFAREGKTRRAAVFMVAKERVYGAKRN